MGDPHRQAGSWTLTAEAFDRLLTNLDSDRERAGEKYEEIRRKLIRLFAWRGAALPEDLADETMNRVARKLEEGVEIQAEDPYRYFCGVAFMVFKEVLREQQRERSALQELRHQSAPVDDPEESSPQLDCLRQCLGELTEEARELVLNYHEGEKGGRIRNRKRLAARLEIPLNALRIRVHRIRLRLETCVKECVAAG